MPARRPSAQDVVAIAKEAGAIIMEELSKRVEVSTKADDSPVTAADKKADAHIKSRLRTLAPDIPILSEESSPEEQAVALANPVHWVLDPLDGTKTAIEYSRGEKSYDQFGVHIALVADGVPVQGVAHFPAMENGKGVTYYTGDRGNALKQIGDDDPQPIKALDYKEGEELLAAVHHKEDRRPETIGGHPYKPVPGVGGQRLCFVAEGKAHIAAMNDLALGYAYKQWDVAAVHAILRAACRAAGGDLVSAKTGETITYYDKGYKIPPAFAGSTNTLHQLGIAASQAPTRNIQLG